VAMLGLLAVQLPAAPFWKGEEAFNFVFGLAPRIVVASLIAFLAGSFLNAYVMSKMKIASGGRHFSARAIWSTVVGEGADSLLFFPLAFGGIIPPKDLLQMMGLQVILKTLYEILVLPLTIRVVKRVKLVEGIDTFDENISYKFWKINDL
ncbi:MAG: queuosine precursor transporter, partial [Bacteroidaceae bacterium]